MMVRFVGLTKSHYSKVMVRVSGRVRTRDRGRVRLEVGLEVGLGQGLAKSDLHTHLCKTFSRL